MRKTLTVLLFLFFAVFVFSPPMSQVAGEMWTKESIWKGVSIAGVVFLLVLAFALRLRQLGRRELQSMKSVMPIKKYK